MASMKILVAVCLFVVLTEGHSIFPNIGGFPGYPPIFRKPLPVSHYSRLSGPIQPPPFFQAPLSSTYVLGFPFIPTDIPEYPEPFVEVPRPFVEEPTSLPRFRPLRYPDPIDPRDFERAFSGLPLSSRSIGNGGELVVNTNEDGKTQTLIIPSSDGKFYRIPQPPLASGTPAFVIPDIPELKLSQFGPRAQEYYY